MDRVIGESAAMSRFFALLFGCFGLLALVLGAVGQPDHGLPVAVEHGTAWRGGH